jgi:hypothetical protein
MHTGLTAEFTTRVTAGQRRRRRLKMHAWEGRKNESILFIPVVEDTMQ